MYTHTDRAEPSRNETSVFVMPKQMNEMSEYLSNELNIFLCHMNNEKKSI